MDTNQDGRKRIVVGVDWGVREDQSVIAILDASSSQVLDVIRHNLKGFYDQRGVIVNLYEQWQPSSIWAESNGIGAVFIEYLIEEEIPIRAFHMTAKNKRQLLEDLSHALESRQFDFVSGLSAIELTDSTKIALALAWYGANQKRLVLK